MVKNYFSETVKGIVQDIFPDIDQLFDKELKGTLNFAYNIVRYGGIQGSRLNSNIGAVTGINDYTSKATSMDELYYTYQLWRIS